MVRAAGLGNNEVDDVIDNEPHGDEASRGIVALESES